MHVTVVGGSGVLGQALVPWLLGRDHTVQVLSPSRRELPGEVNFKPFDLLAQDAPERLAGLLHGTDAVVHAATAVPRDFTAPGAFERLSALRTEGTRRLLEASLAAGVGRYVQQSITLVYPDGGEDWLDEDTPFDNRPEREVIWAPVAEMEAQVRAVPGERMAWCILRGAQFVGPGTFQDELLTALRSGRLRITGDGREFVSNVHVADAAEAFGLAVERARMGSVFNVSDEPLRQGEYLDRLAEALGAPRPGRKEEEPRGLSQRVSSAKLREALGWRPKRGVLPGL